MDSNKHVSAFGLARAARTRSRTVIWPDQVGCWRVGNGAFEAGRKGWQVHKTACLEMMIHEKQFHES